eukprot:135511-Amphidinium_carterae.1
MEEPLPYVGIALDKACVSDDGSVNVGLETLENNLFTTEDSANALAGAIGWTRCSQRTRREVSLHC